MSGRDFTAGRQNCHDYRPSLNEWGMPNVHECCFCKTKEGTVSFCESCMRDHHDGGLDNCEHIGCGCKEPRK
jgi:hypothetical protein